MKRVKKILLGLLTVCALACGAAACGGLGGGSVSAVSSSSSHYHYYTETITKNATCTEDGEKTFTCDCGDSYTETIGALGHDTVSVEGQASTCVSQGWEDYVYCTRCGYTTKALLPLDENNHDLVQCEGKEATCAEFGWNAYEYCKSCSYMTYEEIPATGNHTFIKGKCTVCGSQDHTHTWDEGVVTTEPTCLLPGVKTYTCTCTGTMTESIDPLGHDWNGIFCSRCGEQKISKGLKYGLSIDGTYYSVLGIGTCTDTDIVIPSTYNDLPVTSIGSSAFDGCSSLKSVTIGDSVTSIGDEAFYNCSSLTSVTIGDSVTSIGDEAFYNCSSLTSVTIGDSVTSIGDEAFYNCSSLTSVTIGDSVTSIGHAAFYNCSSLTRVDYTGTIDDWVQISFGNGIWGPYANPLYHVEKLYINDELVTEANITTATKISGYAFSGCSSLTSVTIPDSVTSIGYAAFYTCSSLTSVTIGDSVTWIGDMAFSGCSSLTSIEVSADNSEYKSIDGNLYSKDGTTLIQYAIGKTATTFTVPDSVTSIGSYAFYRCSSLTSVTIGNSVTSICYQAFYRCSSLTSVTIGDSVTSIDHAAFYCCYKLVEVINKSNLTITKESNNGYIAYYALVVHNEETSKIDNQDDYLFITYEDVNYLLGYVGTEKNLILPDSYKGNNYAIYKYAFYNCSSLTSVTIGDSVTSIGSQAFYYCSSLTSVVIPDSVTSIGDGAFYKCSSLEYNVYDNAKYLGNANNPYVALITASSTDITSCDIHNDTKFIHSSAFSGCSSLTSVTIGNSVTSIGEWAFYGCSSLTSVVIPDSVTSIGFYAFSGCSSLTSITFNGTKAQWKAITKGLFWGEDVPATKVVCTDGEVTL